jgi:hypothetical protein
MAAKQKSTKQQQSAKDREGTRNFLLVVVLATIALMALVYFAFVR